MLAMVDRVTWAEEEDVVAWRGERSVDDPAEAGEGQGTLFDATELDWASSEWGVSEPPGGGVTETSGALRRPPLHTVKNAEPTAFDAVIMATWTRLQQGQPVTCLVCGETMEPRRGTQASQEGEGARPERKGARQERESCAEEGGCCRSCGSELS